MAAIRSQLRDFYWQSNGSSWWHRAARVRISAHRFEQLALRYLPELPPDQEELVVADAMIPDAGTAPTKLDEESRQRELSDRRRELEHWEAALRNRELDLRAKAHELTQRETRADRERVALRERERALAEGFAQLERERHELALSANRLLRA